MSNTERNAERCAGIEDKLVEYLDGRAKPAERRAVEEHLTACSSCRNRAEEFRHLWSALDDLPVISPSPAFDASLRARIAAEPARRGFWSWLPSPRADFSMIRDLPVLENYDVLSKFDALSELPAPPNGSLTQEGTKEIR